MSQLIRFLENFHLHFIVNFLIHIKFCFLYMIGNCLIFIDMLSVTGQIILLLSYNNISYVKNEHYNMLHQALSSFFMQMARN